MKRKLFITAIMMFAFAVVLAFAVSAGSVHNESTVDYDKVVKLGREFTLEDGTVTDTVPIFDGEDALIWFSHDGKLKSIRADDNEAGTDGNYVEYRSAKGGALILGNVIIHLGNQTVDIKQIVVFNIMDDDINTFYNPKINQTVEGTEPFIHICETFNRDNKNPNGSMALEYAFLRLDTYNIAGKAFAFCAGLKYVNLEDLTSLVKIGAMDGFNYGACFLGCTSLFSGQMLDLSKTKMTALTWGGQSNNGNFAGVPVAEVKLPLTLKTISNIDFLNCKNLTAVYFGSTVTSIAADAFDGCTALKTIYYVGTNSQLASSPVDDVFADAQAISYTDYKNLTKEQQNAKQYIVFDYTLCAYNNGIHGETEAKNACVGVCTTCGDTVVKHNDDKNLSVTITYTNYGINGEKVTVCNNEGCKYTEKSATPALIACRGYSAPENGRGGIAIGFDINSEAIKEYEAVTGKTLKYGAFAVAQEKLGTSDIFSENGTVANFAIAAEITSYEFSSFELKITGFTDEYKDDKLALGAYVIATDKNGTEYSYIQQGKPVQGEKYAFTSYDEVVNS